MGRECLQEDCDWRFNWSSTISFSASMALMAICAITVDAAVIVVDGFACFRHTDEVTARCFSKSRHPAFPADEKSANEKSSEP